MIPIHCEGVKTVVIYICYSFKDHWIGLHDKDMNGVFQLASGGYPIDYTSGVSPVDYTSGVSIIA